MAYSCSINMAARTGLSLAIATGLSLAASTASAGTPCDPSTLWCSNGHLAQLAEAYDRLPGSIDTGWQPKCNPGTASGHCKDNKIQMRAQIVFDKIKGGGPVCTVDMKKGGMLDARWPGTEFIDLSLPPGTGNDGTFRVAHSLTPEISLYLDTAVFTGEISIDASSFIKYLPGGQFNYAAQNSTKFKPWAFEPVSLNVKGTDLANSRLFAITFQEIADIVSAPGLDDYLSGSFSFNATTDSIFKYQTTMIEIQGATEHILEADGIAQVVSLDGNYLEVVAKAKGMLRYEGTIEYRPVINVDKIGPVSVNLSFPISVGLKHSYGSGSIPIEFGSELVHIPLPNVFVPTTPINFGTVETGDTSEARNVIITNDGELGAELLFSSSNKQFKPTTVGTVMGPDGETFKLGITFRPTKPGKQEAVITVKSNDPDSPIQQIKVTGMGHGDPLDEPDDVDDGPDGGRKNIGELSGDDGCACRTSALGTTTAGTSAWLLGIFGIFALGLRRRTAQPTS